MSNEGSNRKAIMILIDILLICINGIYGVRKLSIIIPSFVHMFSAFIYSQPPSPHDVVSFVKQQE